MQDVLENALFIVLTVYIYMYVLKKMLRRWIFNLRNWKRKPRLPYVILIKHFQTAPYQVSFFKIISSIYPKYRRSNKNSLILSRIKNYSQNILHNDRRLYKEYHFINIARFQSDPSIYMSEKYFRINLSRILF